MKLNSNPDAFVKEYLNDLSKNGTAIFAGSVILKMAGYVNYPNLLNIVVMAPKHTNQ